MTIAIEGCSGSKSCKEAERSTVGMKSCQDEQACYEVKDMIIHNRSCVVTKPAMKRNAQPCMGVAACEYMLDSESWQIKLHRRRCVPY